MGHLQDWMTNRRCDNNKTLNLLSFVFTLSQAGAADGWWMVLFASCSGKQVKDWDTDNFQGERKATLIENMSRVSGSTMGVIQCKISLYCGSVCLVIQTNKHKKNQVSLAALSLAALHFTDVLREPGLEYFLEYRHQETKPDRTKIT